MAPARLVTLVVIRILVVQARFGLGWSMFLLMPKFLVQRYGASAETVGLITAVPGVAIVISAPFVGRLIDRFAPPAFMAIGSALVVTAALGTASADQLDARIYGYQALQGLGFVFCFNAGGAMAAALSPDGSLGRAMSFFGAANLCTNAIAPGIGEYILRGHTWRETFLFAASASLVAFLVAFTLPFRSSPEDQDPSLTRQHTRNPAHSPTTDSDLWRVFAACFLSAFAFMAVFAFHQPFALEAGVVEVSDFFIGWAVCAVLVRLTMGGITDRFGAHRVAFVAQVGYVLPPLLLLALGPHRLWLVGACHGVVHGVYFPVMSTLAVERADPSRRGRALTYQIAAFNGGTTIASAALGALAGASGYPVAFIVAGCVTGLGILALGVPPRLIPAVSSRS